MAEEDNHKELGDLYPAVLHALKKPHKRIVAAVGGDTDDGSEARAFLVIRSTKAARFGASKGRAAAQSSKSMTPRLHMSALAAS